MCGLFQKQIDRKLSAKTATAETAATGTMYCTTPAALVPPPINRPASSGPAIDPMRPTAMLAPEPVPRMAPWIVGRRDTVQRVVGAEQAEAHRAAQAR